MTLNRFHAALATATLIFAVAFAASGHADESRSTRMMSLSGTGEISAPPDSASIRAGVVTEAVDANSALRRNSESVKILFAALKDSEIADRDMRTSSFNVSPIYTRPPRGEPAQITGYRVTNSINIQVRDLSKLGALLDTLVKAGGNKMNGVRFYIEKPQELLDEARRRAVADVRRKADVYAKAAGVEIKRIVSISESGARSPRPMLRSMATMDKIESVPVAAGEQTIRASVTITYEIE